MSSSSSDLHTWTDKMISYLKGTAAALRNGEHVDPENIRGALALAEDLQFALAEDNAVAAHPPRLAVAAGLLRVARNDLQSLLNQEG